MDIFSLPARFVQVKRTYEIINRFLKDEAVNERVRTEMEPVG